MAVRGGFTIMWCKELVTYVTCLFVVMQLPNSKWRPFLKIKIFMSGKTRKILEKSGNFGSEKVKGPWGFPCLFLPSVLWHNHQLHNQYKISHTD